MGAKMRQLIKTEKDQEKSDLFPMGDADRAEELRHHELFEKDLKRSRDFMSSYTQQPEEDLEALGRRERREMILLSMVALLLTAGAVFLYMTTP